MVYTAEHWDPISPRNMKDMLSAFLTVILSMIPFAGERIAQSSLMMSTTHEFADFQWTSLDPSSLDTSADISSSKCLVKAPHVRIMILNLQPGYQPFLI